MDALGQAEGRTGSRDPNAGVMDRTVLSPVSRASQSNALVSACRHTVSRLNRTAEPTYNCRASQGVMQLHRLGDSFR